MLELGAGLAEAGLRAAPDGVTLGFERGRWVVGKAPADRFGALAGAGFSRAGAGTAFRTDGTLASFAADTPRITDRGLLVEEARTNLFLNSAAPAGQTVSLAVGTYCLSAWGAAGSVSATAGTAVGSGWGAVSATPGGAVRTLTITTAGTVVLTVSGAPERVQLELGAFPTRPIVTAGAAATRGLDLPSLAVSIPPGADFAILYEIAVERDIAAGRIVFDLTDGRVANRVRVAFQPTLALQHIVAVGGAVTVVSGAERTAPRTIRGALSRTGTSWRSVLDGVVLAETTLAAMPTLTGLSIGSAVTAAAPLNDTIRQLIIRPGTVDAAWLEAWTQ